MRKTKLIITITSILLVALLLTGCDWGKDPTPPDYPEPPVDSNAETFVETDANGEVVTEDIGGSNTPGGNTPGGNTPGGSSSDGTHTGGGSVGLTYQTDVVISIAQGKAIKMMFANPNRSVDNISIVLYVDGFRVAESGILVPGTQLTTLELNEVGQRVLKNIGVYDGKFLVEFYNGETNEKAVVNTEIPIRAIVQN